MIELTSDALSYAQEHGAEYVEVRGETTEFLDVVVEDRGVVSSIGGLYNGIGIRAFYGSGRGYSATSFITKTSIERAVEEAVRMAKASNFGPKRAKPVEGRVENIKAPMKQDARELETDEKIKEVLALARSASKALGADYVKVHYLERFEDRTVATNYGLRLREIRPSIWIGLKAHGSAGWELDYEDGLVGGWETMKTIKKNFEEFSAELNFQKTDQEADELVLSPRASAQLFMDLILPPFLFPSEVIPETPPSGIRVEDDPGDTASYGFMPFDDEGVKGAQKPLIQSGKVISQLSTRSTDEEGGRARAEDFVHEPGPANTFTKLTADQKTTLPKDYYYVPYLEFLGKREPSDLIVAFSPLTVVYKGGTPIGFKKLVFKLYLKDLEVAGVEGSFASFGCLRELGGGRIPVAYGSETLLLRGASLDRRSAGISRRNGRIRCREAGSAGGRGVCLIHQEPQG